MLTNIPMIFFNQQMDERERIQTILKRVNPKLRKQLSPDKEFILDLVSVDVLTDEEKDRINKKSVKAEKIDALVEIMKRRPGTVYFAFMEILLDVDKPLYDFVKEKQDAVFPGKITKANKPMK